MEVVGIIIGLDVHKRSIYVTELKEDGSIYEQYEIANDEESWKGFGFRSNIDSLTKRKMAVMSIRSRKPKMIHELEESLRILKEKRFWKMPQEHFS